MYILTNHKNVITYISETIDYQSNGNPIIDDRTAIAKNLVKAVYEVSEIPEGVEEYKYCYLPEKGFYKNEKYIEPINEQSEITDLQIAVTELYELIEGGK